MVDIEYSQALLVLKYLYDSEKRMNVKRMNVKRMNVLRLARDINISYPHAHSLVKELHRRQFIHLKKAGREYQVTLSKRGTEAAATFTELTKITGEKYRGK